MVVSAVAVGGCGWSQSPSFDPRQIEQMQIENARQEFELIDPMDIAMVDIDDTVSIEKERRPRPLAWRARAFCDQSWCL